MDITGSTIANFTCTQAGLISGAAGQAGLKGDAASANITAAALVSDSNIQGVGTSGVPLSGITKKDLKWQFKQAGPQIVDSTNLGGFVLDAATTTTITYIGLDGAITAMADSGTNPGTHTYITSVAHGITGTPNVAIIGTSAYNGLFAVTVIDVNTFEIARPFDTNEATGTFESGWEKISGTTSSIETIERFDVPNNNELRSLDSKTLPVTSAVSVTSSKSGSARLFEFALFKDGSDGDGFVKVNGSYVKDVSTRASSLTGIVSFELESNALLTIYTRNMETTDNIDIEGMAINVIRD